MFRPYFLRRSNGRIVINWLFGPGRPWYYCELNSHTIQVGVCLLPRHLSKFPGIKEHLFQWYGISYNIKETRDPPYSIVGSREGLWTPMLRRSCWSDRTVKWPADDTARVIMKAILCEDEVLFSQMLCTHSLKIL